MRTAFLAALLASYSALAAEYRLDAGASVAGGTLAVEPSVHGPAGSTVRYEIRTTREGEGGKSSSSQSGSVRIGDQGSARLASTRIGVSAMDRYRVQVRLLEGSRVVAEEEVRYPN